MLNRREALQAALAGVAVPGSASDIVEVKRPFISELLEYKQASFEPRHLFCTDVKIKRERWFWLKRIAWWLGLRECPVHWDVTCEFRYLP